MKTREEILERIAYINVMYGEQADEGQQAERQALAWVLEPNYIVSEDEIVAIEDRVANENGVDWDWRTQ